MRDPNEIKRALKICACSAFDGCKDCPCIGLNACKYVLMIDALAYIEQLESAPAPAEPENDLPKGWIKIRGDYGEEIVVDASKIASVEGCYPVNRRIVRFAGTFTYSSESVKEILEKIREAT